MTLFGRQADSSSGGGTKIPVRRRLAAGFVGLAALVSVVSVAANPAPDAEPVEQEVPATEIVVDGNSERVTNVELDVRCGLDRTCRVNVPAGGEDISLCPGACEDFDVEGDNWYSVLADGADIETEFPVVRGIVRVDDYQSDVEVVAASAPTPSTDLLEVSSRPGSGTFLEFERVGEPEITFSRSNAVARTSTTPTESDDDVGFVWRSLLGVIAAAISLGFGLAVLFGFYITVRTLLEDGVRYGRGTSDEPEQDEEPVTELEAPITYEMAQERVAVVRDLLDKVREEPDPRRSIQAGFATLETGFGRANLVRGNNETAAAYVRRILGSSEGLREPLGDIVALFERARFSDLPVDTSMRLRMIERLEEVQRDWERRAIELASQAPAAPTGVPVASVAADQHEADDVR